MALNGASRVIVQIKDGRWVAQCGRYRASAPFRLTHCGRRGKGVLDLGKFDALDSLYAAHPDTRGLPRTFRDQ